MDSANNSHEALNNLVVYGKITLSDIGSEYRIHIKSLYIMEHRRLHRLANAGEIKAYYEFVSIIYHDLQTTYDQQIKEMLLELYLRYKQFGEMHGLVFENFP